MVDFIDIIKTILSEQNKTTKDLFNDNIIFENTFYKYKQRYPSLATLLRIANYLQVSVDYIFGFSIENDFNEYFLDSKIIYDNINVMIRNKNISNRKFCKDLHFSRDNIIRWKNGTLPSVSTLLEIRKYLKCLLDDILLP